MSRILRRPMFRGGKVSSYGTGIASGLGYNDGGRVEYANGGSSGLDIYSYQIIKTANATFTVIGNLTNAA